MSLPTRIGRHPVGPCLKLPLAPYIVWANSKGSGETARLRRLALALAICLCDKYTFRINWLIHILNINECDYQNLKSQILGLVTVTR